MALPTVKISLVLNPALTSNIFWMAGIISHFGLIADRQMKSLCLWDNWKGQEDWQCVLTRNSWKFCSKQQWVYSSLDSSTHCPLWPIILQIKHQTCSDWLRLSHMLCSVLRNRFLVPGKRESWCVLWNDLFDSQLRHSPWPMRLWHPGLWLCRGRPTALPPSCTPHLGSPTAPLQTADGYLKCQCWGQEQTDTAYKQ